MTKEQRQELKKMWKERRGERKKSVEEMRKAVDELAEAMKAENPDANAIGEAAMGVAEQRTEHALAAREMIGQLEGILTDDQVKKLNERRKKARKKIKKRMKKIRDRIRKKRKRRKRTTGKFADQHKKMAEKRAALREARRNLRSVAHDPDSSEKDISKAGEEFGSALADVCTYMAEQVATLSDKVDDQKAEKVRKIYEKWVEHRRKMIARFLKHLSSPRRRHK